MKRQPSVTPDFLIYVSRIARLGVIITELPIEMIPCEGLVWLRRILLGLTVVALLANTIPSLGHKQSKWDGNDSNSRLDVTKSSLSHGARYFRSVIVTDDNWRVRYLKGSRYVGLYLNPKGGNRHGYHVLVKYRNGRLRGKVTKIHDDFSAIPVGSALVRRTNMHTLRIAVRKRLVRARGGFVRWQVQSFNGRTFEVAPNGGARMYYHTLSGAS